MSGWESSEYRSFYMTPAYGMRPETQACPCPGRTWETGHQGAAGLNGRISVFKNAVPIKREFQDTLSKAFKHGTWTVYGDMHAC